ncbi:MAG: AMP-binding protein [Anaerolineaceae bacterium]|nr:AMP-binding protein [Anaerolineaceae bacterium]
MTLSNLALTLEETAEKTPDRPAVVFTTGYDHEGWAQYTQRTFKELNTLCDQYAHGILNYGIKKGNRVLILVSPSVDMIAICFALLKVGAVPVVIDPGMKRRAYLRCVEDTEPSAFIGIPKAHLLRYFYPSSFKTVTHPIIIGKRGFLNTPTLASLLPKKEKSFQAVLLNDDTEIAVAFTSGSTGIPKGVIYQQGTFRAQFELMRDEIGIKPGEVDLPGLISFSLFGPALGISEVFPDMDPTHPAQVDPAKLVQTLQKYQVTNSFGSPIIWRRVADYCLKHDLQLPTIRRILMAGAPVPPSLIKDLKQVLVNGEIYTPYGATEAMPLTLMSGTEILEETALLSEQGSGLCVGRPVHNAAIKIITITDGVIPEWKESLEVPRGEIGEIVVKGPMVTQEYLNRPQNTAMAKIYEGKDVWHRMGDLGYYDEKGRLWFCGRKTHRVETSNGLVLPVPCEAIFNLHPNVYRSAVVGVGEKNNQEAVLVIEVQPRKMPSSPSEKEKFTKELLERGKQYEITHPIQKVLFYPKGFPVDVRHNAKIDRLELGRWAGKQLRS